MSTRYRSRSSNSGSISGSAKVPSSRTNRTRPGSVIVLDVEVTAATGGVAGSSGAASALASAVTGGAGGGGGGVGARSAVDEWAGAGAAGPGPGAGGGGGLAGRAAARPPNNLFSSRPSTPRASRFRGGGRSLQPGEDAHQDVQHQGLHVLSFPRVDRDDLHGLGDLEGLADLGENGLGILALLVEM